jgi:CheY-like chemotaxis protein
MPDLDGLAATRRIRASGGPCAAVPIIAMTANAMASDREICLAAGMTDYVSKPFKKDQVLALIARVTSGATPRAEAAVPAK